MIGRFGTGEARAGAIRWTGTLYETVCSLAAPNPPGILRNGDRYCL